MQTTELSLEQLKEIAAKPPVPMSRLELDESALLASIGYLASVDSTYSLGLDPYWPKWNSTWWHMLLLWECGLVNRIPKQIAGAMLHAINFHYIRFFPFTEEEIPEGMDGVRNIMCHCALGSMYQVMRDYGLEVDERGPWMREWFTKYQLEDGGYNCHEVAYTGSHKSSVVSTLPPLEALISLGKSNLSSEEITALDAGAKYLIEKRLFRRSNGEPITEDWLKLCFPRFYEYDVLRGLSFLTTWATSLDRTIPVDSIAEVVLALDSCAADGWLSTGRSIWQDQNTWAFNQATGDWVKRPASTFALLESFGTPPQRSEALTMQWNTVKSRLLQLIENKQLL
jgi:hypothetical protein